MEPQPQFLTISWESNDWEGTEVTMQAVLCLRHRKEIGLEYPSARGCSQPGEACDFCEGRKPGTLQGASSSSSPGSVACSRGPGVATFGSLAPAQQPEIVSVDRPPPPALDHLHDPQESEIDVRGMRGGGPGGP